MPFYAYRHYFTDGPGGANVSANLIVADVLLLPNVGVTNNTGTLAYPQFCYLENYWPLNRSATEAANLVGLRSMAAFIICDMGMYFEIRNYNQYADHGFVALLQHILAAEWCFGGGLSLGSAWSYDKADTVPSLPTFYFGTGGLAEPLKSAPDYQVIFAALLDGGAALPGLPLVLTDSQQPVTAQRLEVGYFLIPISIVLNIILIVATLYVVIKANLFSIVVSIIFVEGVPGSVLRLLSLSASPLYSNVVMAYETTTFFGNLDTIFSMSTSLLTAFQWMILLFHRGALSKTTQIVIVVATVIGTNLLQIVNWWGSYFMSYSAAKPKIRIPTWATFEQDALSFFDEGEGWNTLIKEIVLIVNSVVVGVLVLANAIFLFRLLQAAKVSSGGTSKAMKTVMQWMFVQVLLITGLIIVQVMSLVETKKASRPHFQWFYYAMCYEGKMLIATLLAYAQVFSFVSLIKDSSTSSSSSS